jgi:hypothetical protein
MANKEVLIPRTEDGSIPWRRALDWTPAGQSQRLEEAEPFHAVIQLEDMARAYNGTVRFVWKDVIRGCTYCTSFTHMKTLLKKAEWQGPLLIDGLWMPVKKGDSYFIEYVKPEDS